MSKNRRSLFFEELEPDETFKSGGRTITDADIVLFAGLSGDQTRIHLDETFAQTTVFGGRVAHGALGLSVATGLITQLGTTEDTAMALLDISARFKAPIRVGDTLSVRLRVAEKHETSKADRGVVSFSFELVNQNDETVLEGAETVMVRCRPD
jgi:acyl dehydratase